MQHIFLGDIHGAWGVLNKVFQKNKNTPIIQLGDMGLGFGEETTLNRNTGLWETRDSKNDPPSFPKRFKFIRGNHDNPEKCRSYPNYLGDYGIDEKTGIFYISGAISIDKDYRIWGKSWWPDEELSYNELQKVLDLYIKTKPEIVISHTCPLEIASILSKIRRKGFGSRTEKALEFMWKEHKPKFWLFGHWHVIWRKTILNTNFICAAINQTIKLDI